MFDLVAGTLVSMMFLFRDVGDRGWGSLAPSGTRERAAGLGSSGQTQAGLPGCWGQ